MFKTNSDRFNYGEMLMPPDGYILEAAVGTTYSLDLETLTAIAISVGLVEETDSELMNNPISMLNALQKVSGRILIFSEAGQIKLPSAPSSLCLILEKMVVPVALPFDKKIGRYPAFHPKTWLLSYINGQGKKHYRFVVLSRNLTFDRSWDISLALEGDTMTEEVNDSKPISDFLSFLRRQIKYDYSNASEKRTIIGKLLKELQNVKFVTDSKVFTDFQVIPLGIGKENYDMNQDKLFMDTFHELLIMSPFLSGNIIEDFNREDKGLTDCKRTLITRRSELDKIQKGKAGNFNVYVMKDVIVDGEDALSDEDEKKQKQDIHAKLYLRRKYSDVDLYLGSMNASYSGVNKNVEMLIRLGTKNRYLNTGVFLNDIFGGNADNTSNPFTLVDLSAVLPEAGVDESGKLERQIKDICRLNGKAYIKECEGKYSVNVTFETDRTFDNIIISPLRSNKKAILSADVIFTNMDLLQLSEFYCIAVHGENMTVERVVMIPAVGMPEDREKEIVQSVVKDKKTFMEYVAFVLGDEYLLSMLENKRMDGIGINKAQVEIMPAVYEKMLKTALEEPERIGEIGYLLKMIDDDKIIPKEFRNLYETFRQTIKIK